MASTERTDQSLVPRGAEGKRATSTWPESVRRAAEALGPPARAGSPIRVANAFVGSQDLGSGLHDPPL